MTTAVMEPSNENQLILPTTPPRPDARDKDAVNPRVVDERQLPTPPKTQHWVWKNSRVYAKGGLVNIAF